MYNSKGTYDTLSTMKTPYVTLSSELQNIEITQNNAGEIYGSEYFLNPKSPAEAVNGENNDYSIPLYDKEGLTVIGTFTVKAVTGEYR